MVCHPGSVDEVEAKVKDRLGHGQAQPEAAQARRPGLWGESESEATSRGVRRSVNRSSRGY